MKANKNRWSDKIQPERSGTLPESNYSNNTTHFNQPIGTEKEPKKINTKIAGAALTGAVIGIVLGAAISVLASLVSDLVIPGLGIAMAAPVAAGMAGAGGGVIAGGIIGSLIGSEISEGSASLYKADRNENENLEENNGRNEKETGYFEKWWRAGGGEELYG